MGAQFMLEVDLNGSWTPLCGHATEAEANRCKRYFQPMAAFSGKPMRVIPAAGYAAHQGAVDSHGTQDSVPAGRPTNSPPYGEWCRNPKACAGKGYCPLDPTCGD